MNRGKRSVMTGVHRLQHVERKGVDEDGNVQGSLKPTGIVPGFHKTMAARGIDVPIEVFHPDGQW